MRGPVFHKFLTLGPKKKRGILPEMNRFRFFKSNPTISFQNPIQIR